MISLSKRILVLVILLSLLVSCSPKTKDPAEALWGQWEYYDTENGYDAFEYDIEFVSDGTFLIPDSPYLSVNTYEYGILDENRLRLTAMGKSEILGYELDGDLLKLIFEEGFNLYVRPGKQPNSSQPKDNESSTNTPIFLPPLTSTLSPTQAETISMATSSPTEQPSIKWFNSIASGADNLNWAFSDRLARQDYTLSYYRGHMFYLSDEFNDSQRFHWLIPKNYYVDGNNLFTSIYIGDYYNGQIVSLDLFTGRTLWASDQSGLVIGLGKDNVIVKSQFNRIYALDKQTGQEKWKVIINLLIPEGEVAEPFFYVQNNNGELIVPLRSKCNGHDSFRLLHINEASGESWMTGCWYQSEAPSVYAFFDGVFILIKPYLGGYSSTNGEKLWEFENNIEILQVDYERGVIFFVSYDDAKIHAVDLKTGVEIYSSPIHANWNSFWGSYNITYKPFVFTKYIYQQSDNEVLILNKDDGSVVNKLKIDRSFEPFFAESSFIIFYPELGIAKCYDSATMNVIWDDDEFNNPKDESWLNHLNFLDVMIFQNEDYSFRAVDLNNGNVLWRRKLPLPSVDPFKRFAKIDLMNQPLIFSSGVFLNSKEEIYSIDPVSGDYVSLFSVPYNGSKVGGVFLIEPIIDNYWIVNMENGLALIQNIPSIHDNQDETPTNSYFTTDLTPIPTTELKEVVIEMVKIPAGEFMMGCDPAHNGGFACEDDTLPLHAVYLDAFYIDKYEVTNAQFIECVQAGYCSDRTIRANLDLIYNHPVVYTDSIDGEAYCGWLGKRLPTEAEWEKAARGTSPRAYPWGDQEPDANLSNYCVLPAGVDDCFSNAVGTHPAGVSPYGVHDMAGNVAEWVSDYYLIDYYSKSPYENPKGPTESAASPMCWISGACKKTTLLRGGGFWSTVEAIRTAYRQRPLDGGTSDWGFRCAADADYDPNVTPPVRTPVSSCPGAPTQRLVVGEFGKVCTKSDPVRLRKTPGKSGEVLASLKPGTTFEVVGGPECAGNNWSWWKVELASGQIGWLAEGGDNVDPYFLCPIN